MKRLTEKIFAGRRKAGRIDLEAVETFVRQSLHRTGAAALSHLLQEGPPEQRAIPCSCGHFAHYKELRSNPVLTVVGPVEFQRPYSVRARCHHAPNPTDAALGVEQQEFSPGVRRMMAVVGSGSPFDLGREQLELLAGLHVSTTPVVDLLDKGEIQSLVALLRSLVSERPELAAKLESEAEYSACNADKMRYTEFRAQDLSVGSGVIEAGCKTVMASRRKQSGMFWTVEGANRIIALRCCRVSGKSEDFWEVQGAA